MNNKIIIEYLKNNLEFNRFLHCVSVGVTANNLAESYNVFSDDFFIAGLLHDIAKMKTTSELITLSEKYNIDYKTKNLNYIHNILHSHVGAYIAKDLFNINKDIFNAIYTHTAGDKEMSFLQKVIFIADFIEPFRDKTDEIDKTIKKLAYEDIDLCVYKILKLTIEKLNSFNVSIYYKTKIAYEFYKSIIDER